jgi:hypothetical protein
MTAMKKATDIYVYFQEASRNIIGPKEWWLLFADARCDSFQSEIFMFLFRVLI